MGASSPLILGISIDLALRPFPFWHNLVGVTDIVDVAHYGVGDVPVLRVTTAGAVFLIGIDVDVGNIQVVISL